MIRRIRAGGYAGQPDIAWRLWGGDAHPGDLSAEASELGGGFLGAKGAKLGGSSGGGDCCFWRKRPRHRRPEVQRGRREGLEGPQGGRRAEGSIRVRTSEAAQPGHSHCGGAECRAERRVGGHAFDRQRRVVVLRRPARRARGRADVRGLGRPEGLHARRRARGNRLIAHQRLTPRLTIDDHNNPSLYVRTDGRIMVFYRPTTARRCSTGSPPSRTRSRASRRRTGSGRTRLGDGATRTRTRFGPTAGCGCCSGAPTGSRLHDPRGAVVARADPRSRAALTRAPRRAPRPRRAPPALRQVRERRRAHPRDVHRGQPRDFPNSIWYAWFDHTGIYRASGRRVARLGAAPPVRRLDRVRANSGYQQWALDIAVSPFGPIIVYMRRTLRPEYWWARYDGRRWRNYRITRYAHTPRSPGAVGGATLDHEDPSIVYLSRLTPDRPGHDVEVWRTPDGGRSWKRTTITRSRPTICGRSALAGSRATARCSGFPGGGPSGRRSTRASSPASPRPAARGR